MKKNYLLLFSFLFVCTKFSFSNTDDAGLIFFTNFKYFKSNERNFKSVQNNVSKFSSINTSIPDKSEPPIIPSIPIPPEIKPNIPEKPIDFSKIFFNNNWIFNTHHYTSSKDLEISSSNSFLIGMGAIDTGFSIVNTKILTIDNELGKNTLIGMLSLNGGEITNDSSGYISVKGVGENCGMFTSGLGSLAQNYGTIDISNGLAAIIINGQGSSVNLGTIDLKNTKYGMLSLNGGIIINGGVGLSSEIVNDNNELSQMAVFGTGSAYNYGSLSSSNAPHIMYLLGNGNLTNYGEISIKTSNYDSSFITMFGENGGTLTNAQGATINIDGGDTSYAMGLLNSGHIINNGTINVGNFQNGILLTGNATGTNNGTIKFSLMGTGVALYNTTKESYFANFGSIEDTLYENGGGDFGIYATGNGTIENLGTIRLRNGFAGMYISGAGEAINYQEGNINIYQTRYGMYATNGATIINEGNINIDPLYNTYMYPNGGMFVENSGTAINNGVITFGGSSTNGMSSIGPNTNLINGALGVINILNDSSESFAFNNYKNGGIATNKGVINLGVTGGLINGGTLFNYGYINAPNGINNANNGILVMERGGTINTVLKESVLGLSYAQELYSKDTNFMPLNLSFSTESATSYSHLYEVYKKGEDFLMRRKNFTETTQQELGNFLEDIYFDNNNNSKDKFFNILMSSQNKDQYNQYLDSFFGRDIYPNIIFQTKDTIQYATQEIIDNLKDKLSKNKKSSYIIGYTFEKFRQKGFDRVEGHEDNINGFYLGKQYYLDNAKDYGFVFSYMRLDSDYYSDSGNREDNFLQGTSFLNYNKNNINGIGALYLGYSTGNIKRDLELNYLDYSGDYPSYSNIKENYKGDVKNIYLGISGNFSKQYNFNSFFLEPEIAGYLLGIHQKKITESDGEYEVGIDSLNSVFSKIKTEIAVGKTFTPMVNYLITFKVVGALAQEFNSKNNNLDVTLKNISDERATIKVNKDDQFSKEIGSKINIQKSSLSNFNFYVDYKYIFEDNNSWKISTGINYSF